MVAAEVPGSLPFESRGGGAVREYRRGRAAAAPAREGGGDDGDYVRDNGVPGLRPPRLWPLVILARGPAEEMVLLARSVGVTGVFGICLCLFDGTSWSGSGIFLCLFDDTNSDGSGIFLCPFTTPTASGSGIRATPEGLNALPPPSNE